MSAQNDNPDRTLTARLIRGDIAAYEILYYKYYPTFCVFIKGMAKDEAVAEDIAQNIFMKVWLNREELDEELSIKNYLYVLARNEVLNHFRSKQASLTYIKNSLRDNPLASEARQEIESEYNVREINETVTVAMERMPEKRRAIFYMSRFEYMTNKDIAERLGLSVRTVDKHIELALRDIRRNLSSFSFFLFMLLLH